MRAFTLTQLSGRIWHRQICHNHLLRWLSRRVSNRFPKIKSMCANASFLSRVGRRLPLIVGASMQATAMLYLALYLRFAGDNVSGGNVGGTSAGGIVGIIWIYVYAFGWSFGHSVACYVVAAEIFPSRIVSLSSLWRTHISFC